MPDDYTVPGEAPIGDAEPVDGPSNPDPEVVADRYAMPDEEEVADVYVRHEAPWVGFGGGGGAPGSDGGGATLDPDVLREPAPGETPSSEPEFTILVRPRRRGREAVAAIVSAVILLLAVWYLPGLLSPATEKGRVAAYVILAIGGITVVLVERRMWRWALGRE